MAHQGDGNKLLLSTSRWLIVAIISIGIGRRPWRNRNYASNATRACRNDVVILYVALRKKVIRRTAKMLSAWHGKLKKEMAGGDFNL